MGSGVAFLPASFRALRMNNVTNKSDDKSDPSNSNTRRPCVVGLTSAGCPWHANRALYMLHRSKFVLSQTMLGSTEFIEKRINIYHKKRYITQTYFMMIQLIS